MGCGAAVAALAIAGAGAQPAGAQILPPAECVVSGGGQIVAANGDMANFGGSASTERSHLGHEVYIDHGPATEFRFRSLVMTAVVCDPDARRADLVGTGEVLTGLGQQIVEYRIAMFVPNNRGGTPDFYRITLSPPFPYDSGLQPVERGNITLHFP
jgi:hypothetical protein